MKLSLFSAGSSQVLDYFLKSGSPRLSFIEDDALIILNKPAGQSTIPSRDHPSGTIANLLAGKFAEERLPSTVHVVTRLDKDTSGLICVAKNRHIHHLLSEQMIEIRFS